MSGISLLTDVANALSQRFAYKLSRQFNRQTVLANIIPSESTTNGKNVAWDTEFSGAVALSHSEGVDIAGSELTVDIDLPANLSWAIYTQSFQVSETQLDAAAMSAGSAEALVNLLSSRFESGSMKLASLINADLWTGTGVSGGIANIVGILGGALEVSGVYAGIDRATYAEWKGNVLANGGIPRALTIDLMDQMDANIYRNSGIKPNVIVCDPDTFRKYKGLFEPLRRIEGTGPIPNYSTSTSELFYNGMPILRDKDAPLGTMAFLNTDQLRKVYLPSSFMSVADVMKVRESEGMGGNGEPGDATPIAIPFKLSNLAKNGDSFKFMTKAQLNLKVMRPNSMGYISDIQTA